MSRTTPTLRAIRNTRPATADHLWDWVYLHSGVRISRTAVCPGHQSPFEAFAAWWLDRPSVALWLGPRGGGKSFLSAINTHLTSRFQRNHKTRILGGSLAQSQQIYEAISEAIRDGAGPLGSDSDTLAAIHARQALYRNGSQVSILAASPTSVRGPHVPSLKLDEVDEIDPQLREDAMGMCMAKHDSRASVLMTSTWHRVGGPMSALIEEARSGRFPLHSFCLFEVLERCPESRSGPDLEGCQVCPLKKWCHSDRDTHPSGLPKAKRSDGHYTIDAAIQKLLTTSARVFEADYLCSGPRADGLWFPTFTEPTHVRAAAEYDPALPVHLAIDSGVFTGAVWFQIGNPRGIEHGEEVAVFADYLAEGVFAEANARAILDVGRRLCNGQLREVSTDPAGGARNSVGPSVLAEYQRAGLKTLKPWPQGPVADGLALVESFLCPAEGSRRLTIHPRCTSLITALAHYRRAKHRGQWMDYPEDPQHPFEDLVDALRGGLRNAFPQGRKVKAEFRRVNATRLIH